MLLLYLITLHYARTCTLGRTPLYEGSARCRHLYLTIHTNPKWQTSMSPAGFEPAIPESERPQIRALDSSAIGIGHYSFHHFENTRNSLLDSFLYFLNPCSFFNISVFIHVSFSYSIYSFVPCLCLCPFLCSCVLSVTLSPTVSLHSLTTSERAPHCTSQTL